MKNWKGRNILLICPKAVPRYGVSITIRPGLSQQVAGQGRLNLVASIQVFQNLPIPLNE